ncbi:hypothetical protein DOTSEDRAFT_50660 [Dothistroma septosporum NZE10]|uniref:Uncharacterized protein n=1 Tax=Dothistroma septosporum (strain NZE10 / CBS 128990) TaxID=675120 RepID=N1PW70_DOTSN|nr:hypothetical protein DOTSEDRAFT_50660 [Dothistroma septosporum NZE10]
MIFRSQLMQRSLVLEARVILAQLLSTPRTINSQPIGSSVTRIFIVALYPLEPDTSRATVPVSSFVRRVDRTLVLHAVLIQSKPLLQHVENLLHEIFVLDRLASGVYPVVALPIDKPVRHAVDGVLAVADDDNSPVLRSNFECSNDGCEFGAVIGLLRTRQWFAYIPSIVWAEVDTHTAPCADLAVAERAAVCVDSYGRVGDGTSDLIHDLLPLFSCLVACSVGGAVKDNRVVEAVFSVFA